MLLMIYDAVYIVNKFVDKFYAFFAFPASGLTASDASAARASKREGLFIMRRISKRAASFCETYAASGDRDSGFPVRRYSIEQPR